MSFQSAQLKTRALLRIEGEEATDFLQGLFTNDVEKLAPGGAQFSALLSPQGKILFDFILVNSGTGFLLDAEAEHIEALLKKLKLYRLRAKVTLELDESLAVFAAYPAPDTVWPQEIIAFDDPRDTALGARIIAQAAIAQKTLSALGGVETSEASYASHRRELGVAEGTAELGHEKLFALEANLEDRNGVDFKKGCYVGQELTARMKHKAKLKKRLLPYLIAQAVAPGTALLAGERTIGEVIGSSGNIAFVLTRLDRLAESDKSTLTLDGQPAALIMPPFLLAQ